MADDHLQPPQDARAVAAVAKARKEWRADIETTRAFVLEVVAQGIGECWQAMADDAAGELSGAMAGLHEAFALLKVQVAEMRLDLARARENAAADKLRTLDLPAIPSRRTTDLN
jgi:hypothetical protein